MINDRIKQLIEVLGLNPSAFSESINVSVAVIFNIIKGRRSKPSYELILKILNTYKNLSTDWLIMGKGSMWNDLIVDDNQILRGSQLENRIKVLLAHLKDQLPQSKEVIELNDLVHSALQESLN